MTLRIFSWMALSSRRPHQQFREDLLGLSQADSWPDRVRLAAFRIAQARQRPAVKIGTGPYPEAYYALLGEAGSSVSSSKLKSFSLNSFRQASATSGSYSAPLFLAISSRALSMPSAGR